MNEIESEAQWTSRGFMQRFDQIMTENKDNPDFRYTHAYSQAEEEHIKLFKKTRFKSYDSFREYRRQIIFPK